MLTNKWMCCGSSCWVSLFQTFSSQHFTIRPMAWRVMYFFLADIMYHLPVSAKPVKFFLFPSLFFVTQCVSLICLLLLKQKEIPAWQRRSGRQGKAGSSGLWALTLWSVLANCWYLACTVCQTETQARWWSHSSTLTQPGARKLTGTWRRGWEDSQCTPPHTAPPQPWRG